MGKTDWVITSIMVIGGLCIAATILWAVFTYENAPEIVYLLPNGVTCEWSFLTGTRAGRSTHEFSRCSDGYIHINPEKYRRVIKR